MANPIKGAVAGVRAALSRHERRAQPSGLDFAFADRIDALNPAHWDALVANASFFASRDYRRLLERHAPEGMGARYALAYRGDEPIVALAAQLLDVRGDQVANLEGSKMRKRAWLN